MREGSSLLLLDWVADMKAAGLNHTSPSLTALVQVLQPLLRVTHPCCLPLWKSSPLLSIGSCIPHARYMLTILQHMSEDLCLARACKLVTSPLPCMNADVHRGKS